MNMQNIPSKGVWAKIRHCVALPEDSDYILIDRDLSQFEVRALADMAGEEKMMDFFRKADEVEAKILKLWKSDWDSFSEASLKKYRKDSEQIDILATELEVLDFHTLNAREIFGSEFDKAQGDERKELRKRAKTLTFAIPYGTGPKKIARTFGLPPDRGQEMIDLYYASWPKIAKFLTKQRMLAIRKKFTLTPAGRKRFYNLGDRFGEEDQKMIRSGVERAGTNAPIQGANADVVKLASVYVQKTLKKYGARILLWVHDEILILCPKVHQEIVHTELDRCLRQAAIDCGIRSCPIKTSLEISHAWSH